MWHIVWLWSYVSLLSKKEKRKKKEIEIENQIKENKQK